MADNYFERFLGVCEDAEPALPPAAYRALMYDIARNAIDKADASFDMEASAFIGDGGGGKRDLIAMLERDLIAAEGAA